MIHHLLRSFNRIDKVKGNNINKKRRKKVATKNGNAILKLQRNHYNEKNVSGYVLLVFFMVKLFRMECE